MTDPAPEIRPMSARDWARRLATPVSADDIAAAIGQARLVTYTGKLSAAQQRALFGINVFGRKSVSFNDPHVGEITVRWAVAGLDTCFKVVTFAEIAAHVNGTAHLDFS